jgi:hypothetical protein
MPPRGNLASFPSTMHLIVSSFDNSGKGIQERVELRYMKEVFMIVLGQKKTADKPPEKCARKDFFRAIVKIGILHKEGD